MKTFSVQVNILKTILVSLLIMLSKTAGSQSMPIYLQNPSFEGQPTMNGIPAPWYQRSVNLIAYTLPLGSSNEIAPSDGKTYAALLAASENNTSAGHAVWTSIGQQLSKPIEAGKAYLIHFDMALMPEDDKSDKTAATTTALAIRGADTENDLGERIWYSGVLYERNWKRFTAVLKPKKTYAHLRFEPYVTDYDDTCYVVTFLDNISMIEETLNFDVSAEHTCFGQNAGKVAVTMNTLDKDNYTFRWEPGGYTTQQVSQLPAGTYTVTVTNTTKGNSRAESIEVRQWELKMAPIVTGISCNGESDAAIDINASGGRLPYTYSIVNYSPEQDSAIFSNLRANYYTLRVTDSMGCYKMEGINIGNPLVLHAKDVETKPLSCSSVKDGQIIITPAGGTAPYQYSISDTASQSENRFRRLDAGTYHYKIVDDHKCSVEGNVTVERGMNDCAIYMPSAFSPNGDGMNDLFKARVQDDVTDFRMMIFGRWGQLVYETTDPEAGWNGRTKGTELPSGTYVWKITYTDSKKQLMQQQGTVTMFR
ncbi:T9SS type B sorting domain-containing protein [Chitinophaga rhizophila]|uniref:Gliding motility-associated C-terminal domain-containing protein n=1 Tax=Chitinophaga rhizophila TaxID=2866212 RepID=A0ABS7G7D1_9BACT|nr:gliding motility-associated C-terminal domain-containing protein [Chitinophaga rhizophila]MBW8683361.1 gliding motility-associated C-terminal domain-containing protein [Chitinophaga rhizophila]